MRRESATIRKDMTRANLFVFKSKQKNLLHEGELGLFAPLCALADVSWIESDLVAVFAALVARLGGAVIHIVGGIGPANAAAAISIASTSSSTTSAPGEARRCGRHGARCRVQNRVGFSSASVRVRSDARNG